MCEIPKIGLGKTGLVVPALGFGCSKIASVNMPSSPQEVRQTLDQAVDQGITLFDTADIYGQGDSERLLGRMDPAKKNRMVLCTKTGLRIKRSQALIRVAKPLLRTLQQRNRSIQSAVADQRQQAQDHDLRPETIERRITASLRRLRREAIDIYLLHAPLPHAVQDQDIISELLKAKGTGRIRFMGASYDNIEDAWDGLNAGVFDILQFPVNLFSSNKAHDLLSACEEQGVGVIANQPFSSGRIFRDDTLSQFCGVRKGVSPVDIAFQYLLEQETPPVIIAGMTSQKHLHANIKAVQHVPRIPLQEMDILITDIGKGS